MSEFTPQPNFEPVVIDPTNIAPSGDGSVLKTGVFKSPNYVAGVSGWCIFSNGDVEFNDGTFRGTLTAGAISTATGFSLYPIWGSGSDGAVTYNGGGTSTLTQDLFATNLTITNNTTLNTAGYRVFYNGTCTIDSGSKIAVNGGNGGNGGNATGVAAGTGGTAGATAHSANTLGGGTAGQAGGNGGPAGGAASNGVNGTAVNPSFVAGVAGGTGGSSAGGGGTGGTAGTSTAPKSRIRTTFEWESVRDLGNATLAQIQGASGSGSGGGGGGGFGGTDYGGGGGGSGAPGGVICFIGKTLVLNGTIEAKGGNGGNGGNGNNNGCGGGGGGAGSGGLIVAVYGSKTGSGSFTVAGGTKGTGGTGGSNGNNGNDGNSGTLIEIDL